MQFSVIPRILHFFWQRDLTLLAGGYTLCILSSADRAMLEVVPVKVSCMGQIDLFENY